MFLQITDAMSMILVFHGIYTERHFVNSKLRIFSKDESMVLQYISAFFQRMHAHPLFIHCVFLSLIKKHLNFMAGMLKNI